MERSQSFAQLTKFDVTGLGILLIEKDGFLFVASPPLAGSTAAEADVSRKRLTPVCVIGLGILLTE